MKVPAISKVSYGPTGEAWEGFSAYIESLIETRGLRRVCDIGGGANPLLGPDYIRANGLSYSVLDISQGELDKSPPAYDKIRADITGTDLEVDRSFDLVFSKMLAEHVGNRHDRGGIGMGWWKLAPVTAAQLVAIRAAMEPGTTQFSPSRMYY